MRQYPYVERRIKLQSPQPCEKCGAETTIQVEMRETWFKGENEDYILCQRHLDQMLHQIDIRHKEWVKRAELYLQRKEKEKSNILETLKAKYEVREFSPYQWRINGIIDIYPTNKNYHLIKENKRGSYNNLIPFLDSILSLHNNQ